MEEDEMTYGIDRLAELLAERDIEFCVGDRTSLVFMDGVGNLHECWMAGAEENLVNVCITIMPEQVLSVRDLNGIVSENAKLRDVESENASLRGAVQGLGELCDKYKAENAKLREERREYKATIDSLVDECTDHKAENAKLRESVRNILICIKHEECEESCPNYEPMYTDYGYEKNGSTVVESEYLGCCTVGLENCNSMLFDTDEYLRELGIEVPHDN